ncbi:hypothetical protein ABPG72_006034 [Tetrahymena utriculariae]
MQPLRISFEINSKAQHIKVKLFKILREPVHHTKVEQKTSYKHKIMSFAQVQQKVPTIQDYIQASPLPLLGFLGGLAASTAETLTFAFDNIKTRMQMNGKQGMPSYSGFGDCIKKTLNTTGFRGFYKGLSAALFRQITYSSVRMWVYENIKRTYFGSDPSFFMKLAAGGFAGAVGCLVGTPGDVFKIRLINDMQGLKYKGLIDCAQKTFQADGYKGFLKGLNVNITRAIVVNAAELASYDQAKGFLVNQCQFKSDSLWTHFLGSTAAGFMGAVCSSPVDVIKTRFMNQVSTEGALAYKSATECGLKVLKTEGFGAFYKGFFSYFLRIGPWNVFFFMAYEQYKAFALPRLIKF